MVVPESNDVVPVFVVFMGGDFAAGGMDCARGDFGDAGFPVVVVAIDCVRGTFGDGDCAPPTAEDAKTAAAVAVPATAPDPFITIASLFLFFCCCAAFATTLSSFCCGVRSSIASE